MNLLIGSLTIGLIFSLLAIGVYLSFRIFNFPDITADGSFPLGAAVAAALIVNGYPAVLATVVGFVAGVIAGAITGFLHTRFKIHGLLAGILMMTALYSVNLHIMGRSNVPLLSEPTLISIAERAGLWCSRGDVSINLFGWETAVRDIAALVLAGLGILLITEFVYLFFRTHMGMAMRATGNNPTMIRALGVSTNFMIVVGLALSNGLIALSGALMAQYQGFADVQMGIGMIVWGLASVIIGEALVRSSSFGLTLIGALMGSILFRLLVAIALRWGLNPNDLKLITAVFVFAALILPSIISKLNAVRERRHA